MARLPSAYAYETERPPVDVTLGRGDLPMRDPIRNPKSRKMMPNVSSAAKMIQFTWVVGNLAESGMILRMIQLVA